MKRILFFLLAALLVVGGGLAYILLSDSPDKVLKDGLTNLVGLTGAGTLQLDVSWTNAKTKSTTGFTYKGPVDLRDPIQPNISGLIRVGAGAGKLGPEDQTGDLVAVKDYVALRPRSVGPELRAAYIGLAGITSTKPYVRFEREAFLESLEADNLITETKGEDVRKAFAFIVPLALPQGGLIQTQSATLGPLEVVYFKIDRSGISPFVYNLLKVWYGRAPTAEELGLIDRLVQGAGSATFRLAVTKKTHVPVELVADFPYVDRDNKPTPITVHAVLSLGDVGQIQSIVLPSGTVDANIGMTGAQANITLPSAGTSTNATTSTDLGTERSFGQMVGGAKIDLYQNYIDTLKKRRVMRPRRK